MAVTVGLVDDHRLFVQAFAEMVNDCNDFHITLLAYSGKDLLDQLSYLEQPPEILLMGLGNPVTDEIEIAEALKRKYPGIKMLALFLDEDQPTLITIIKLGFRGWLSKLITHKDLENALLEVQKTGYHNPEKGDLDLGQLVSLTLNSNRTVKLNENERLYLELASSDLNSKQIAGKMNVSEKTVHRHFSLLCHKLFVTSRAGLTLEAARQHLVLPV